MKLPEFDDIEFSPLAWKEWLVYGDQSEFPSKKRIYSFLRKQNREGVFEWCGGIENHVRNNRIRRLLNGYAILDLLNESQSIDFIKVKMWRMFEDTVGEILREVIKDKEECSVAHVDRWPGFKGLDYIITNSKSRLGWKVGVQCKKYVGTRIPYSRVDEYSSYTRGTSASKLYDKGLDLKERFTHKRKTVLVMFEAFKKGKLQKRRFDWLKEVWDSVVVFNKPPPNENVYTYRLHFDQYSKIARWC